jgi:hypothetical protein
MLGKSINEIILAAVSLIGDNDYITAWAKGLVFNEVII